MYLVAKAPIVPERTNDRMANGTDSRSKTNFIVK
jgi:hypothetical protein